jgi:hypothetical protein
VLCYILLCSDADFPPLLNGNISLCRSVKCQLCSTWLDYLYQTVIYWNIVRMSISGIYWYAVSMELLLLLIHGDW